MAIKRGNLIWIEPPLASGGMAEIWRVINSGAEGIKNICVVKRILLDYVSNPRFKQMFVDEARITAQLHKPIPHPNIIQVLEFQQFEDEYLLFLEYINGVNIRKILTTCGKKQISFPIAYSLHIISQVLDGLYHAHNIIDSDSSNMNIIHRDISPQNILVSYGGDAKIIDWGIADAKFKSFETVAGEIKGKYAYMSPEQANGEKLDFTTDIYSAAIVLWEMLTGKMLFGRGSNLETLKRIQSDQIEDLGKHNKEVSRGLGRILNKALSKKKEKRFSNALEFSKAIIEERNRLMPDFSPVELAEFLQSLFKEDIERDRVVTEEAEKKKPSEVPAVSDRRRKAARIPTELDRRKKGKVLRKAKKTVYEKIIKKARSKIDGGQKEGQKKEYEKDFDNDYQFDGEYEEEEESLEKRRSFIDKDEGTITFFGIKDEGLELDLADVDLEAYSAPIPYERIREAQREFEKFEEEKYKIKYSILILFFIVLFIIAGVIFLKMPDFMPFGPKATVILKTIPPGATVYVDGVKEARSTPDTLFVPAEKEIKIRFRMTGFHDKEFKMKSGKKNSIKKMTVKLKPTHKGRKSSFSTRNRAKIFQKKAPAVLKIESRPSGATVYIASDRVCTTPCAYTKGYVGQALDIDIDLPGYQRFFTAYTLKKRKDHIKAMLVRSGKSWGFISITSIPPGYVYVDGRYTGRRTPLRKYRIEAGSHTVRVIKKMGRSQKKKDGAQSKGSNR